MIFKVTSNPHHSMINEPRGSFLSGLQKSEQCSDPAQSHVGTSHLEPGSCYLLANPECQLISSIEWKG